VFRSWMDRAGGAKAIAATLEDLAEFPDPDEHPEFYVDYDETGPYEAVTGESECAT
jgi:sulfite reductase (ferredoxin)